jgi:hypothetical protein
MYVASREVGALTNALHRCLARLVTSALELQVDLRAGGLLDGFFGGGVEGVAFKTAGGRGKSLHRCTQPSEKRACIPSTRRTKLAMGSRLCVLCLCPGRSGTQQKSSRVQKRAVQKASGSESEQFIKRAVHEASSSESEQFIKQAVHEASSSESEQFTKQALQEASTCAISTSQYKASSEHANKQVTEQAS